MSNQTTAVIVDCLALGAIAIAPIVFAWRARRAHLNLRTNSLSSTLRFATPELAVMAAGAGALAYQNCSVSCNTPACVASNSKLPDVIV